MADVASNLYDWSTTPGSNNPSGSTAIGTGLDDNLREIQAVARQPWSRSTVASAATCDIGANNAGSLTISGTTTITSFGTVSAGIRKWLTFSGALTLTHNATSLILPTGANITTAAGDVACFESLGSGNWRCLSYTRASGASLISAQLSGIAAAAAANSINNGDYAQVWNWSVSTASKIAFRFSENSASTGSSAVLLQVDTIASSTAWPLYVKARTSDILAVNASGLASLTSAASQQLRIGYTSAGSPPTSTTPADILVKAQGHSSTGAGGKLTLSGGATTGGTVGGDVEIIGGDGGSAFGNVNVTGKTITLEASTKVALSTSDLAIIGGSLPTISSGGGTGAAISGRNNAFVVTMGTGSPTSVTVAFGATLASTPVVVATSSQSGQVLHVASVSTTSVQISSSSSASSGTKWNVIVLGIA